MVKERLWGGDRLGPHQARDDCSSGNTIVAEHARIQKMKQSKVQMRFAKETQKEKGQR